MSRGRVAGAWALLAGCLVGLGGCSPDKDVPGMLEATKPRMDREVETAPPAPAPKAERSR